MHLSQIETGPRRIFECVDSTTEIDDSVDISNLAACVEDARQAALSTESGPDDPTQYAELRGRLETAKVRMPPAYLEGVHEPYTRTLDSIGSSGFNEILLRDAQRTGAAGLMLDIAHSILQNGEQYQETSTDGFQEIVSDLYDGFLSAEDRQGVRPPERGVLSPLVKWGNPSFGPYTWPADATSNFGIEAAVVNLPPANGRCGLLAWSALGHETAGHDILHADDGLQAEAARTVRKAVGTNHDMRAQRLDRYWSERIDETASDVLGILNMGPAAAIGLVGYFRGLNAAWGSGPQLRPHGSSDDVHPSDLMRAYLGAEVVRGLSFSKASAWAALIEAEADRDAPPNGRVYLGGVWMPLDIARESAKRVAQALATTPFDALEQHALIEIQDWADEDEATARVLEQSLTTASFPQPDIENGFYAAHVVAAATMAALRKNAVITVVFDRMTGLLKRMHDANPSWGPLYVRNASDIYRHRTYVPFAAPERDGAARATRSSARAARASARPARNGDGSPSRNARSPRRS